MPPPVFGNIALYGERQPILGRLLCFWLLAVVAVLRQEEALLTKRLAGYAQYMDQTKALVPFLF